MANGTNGNDFIHRAGDGLVGATGSSELLLATTGNDRIFGWGGDDKISGGGGVDSLFGGTGNDILWIQSGDFNRAGQIFYGGDGTDVLVGADTFFRTNITGDTVRGIEQVKGFVGGLTLTAGQLAGFSTVDTGQIHVTDGGSIDLTGVAIRAPKIFLSEIEATTLVISTGHIDPVTGDAS